MKNYLKNKSDNPFENLGRNIPLCSIFRTIGCVGDSLSSGEFEYVNDEGKTEYLDFYEYSWGQFIARATGSTVYNFSKGGMTAAEYCNSFAENNGFWDKEKACQAYILALGVNDVCVLKGEVGAADDIDLNDWNNNKKTFAGYYAQIIQRLREISPNAKFFLMTMPKDSRRADDIQTEADRHCSLLYKLAEMFENTYVMDFRKYADAYDADFRKTYFFGGHMSPLGYVLTAEMVMAYMDYIIRENPKDFKQTGFIGTRYYRDYRENSEYELF